MTRYLFAQEQVFSLASIHASENATVSPRPGVSLNPPPADACCQSCQRHITEVAPFGKAGDPLEGDFEGEGLVKTWRRMGPPDEEAERLFTAFFGHCVSEEDRQHALARMIQAYGEEKATAICGRVQLADTIAARWLCRDCILR